MADILFKRGTQADFNGLETYQDGCFYLTTDSHRLYVGLDDEKAYPVNEGIIKVESVSALPELAYGDADYGAFYYAQKENVLCIRKPAGSGSGEDAWWQINANTDIHVESVTVLAVQNEDGSVNISTTYNYNNEGNFEGNFKIVGKNGIKVEKGTGNNEVTITGNAYTLSSDASTEGFKITLTPDAKDLKSSSVTLKLAGMIKDEDGTYHPTDTSIKEFKVEPNPEGEGFVITITDNNNTTSSVEFNPKISVGSGDPKTTVTFGADGIAQLPVYTTTEVDEKLRGLDAMSFKGTVGENGSLEDLPTEGVHSGDTYLVSGHIEGNDTAKKGDMYIATGEEGPDGTITGEITWTYVPSGDDAISTYFGVVDATQHLFNIQDAGGETVASWQLAAGTAVTLTSEDVDSTHRSMKTTIGHADVVHTNSKDDDLEQDLGGEIVIPAVTGVTVNAQGHVVDVKTQKFTIHDSNIQDVSSEMVVIGDGGFNKAATVQTTTAALKSDSVYTTAHSEQFSLKTTNDSITISADPSQKDISLNLVWGNFV